MFSLEIPIYDHTEDNVNLKILVFFFLEHWATEARETYMGEEVSLYINADSIWSKTFCGVAQSIRLPSEAMG